MYFSMKLKKFELFFLINFTTKTNLKCFKKHETIIESIHDVEVGSIPALTT